MKRTVITTNRTIPRGKIIVERDTEAVLKAANDLVEKNMASALMKIVDDARRSGSYANLTGNLRRMITPNALHAQEVEKYQSREVLVQVSPESDPEIRNQYTPPGEFDEPYISVNSSGGGKTYTALIAAVMPYAATLEAKGYLVLSQTFNKFLSNPGEFFKSTPAVTITGKQLQSK